MEIQQPWRLRLSFKSATIALNIFNVLAAVFLLQWFLSSAFSRTRISSNQPNPGCDPSSAARLSVASVLAIYYQVDFNHIKDSEEIRLAMQPLELIKRVKEIQQEAYAEPETIQPNDAKQTAAVDLSKRLKDFRSVNDASSLKALEEWRKRKMERARQRELEKNVTVTAQA